jgi:hypothetical protein
VYVSTSSATVQTSAPCVFHPVRNFKSSLHLPGIGCFGFRGKNPDNDKAAGETKTDGGEGQEAGFQVVADEP